ncbi:class A beta-lactamase-related serine hydrolase [Actinomadura darangshiensis]|uniref:Class A beta-lactamase-related serine hydrolase n=1 Tax=Actinomadura darangshiensis TaxID=705336 RepID=A0A4R5AEF3_9ACTN|nr:serine hydrolase domain-containing protein [Actinomadura darangshiensis]TDD70893.1 class A beta-lactamase-related serine hydrolase [Actinomadura darangshiensis]
MSSTVQGHCDPAFAGVREVFEQNFAEGRELGAAVTVYAGDRKVVDLWGGVADRRTGREWLPDTPCFGFSCTKAVTAAAALLLAERGAYEVDGPVTGWWPEFGAEGKDGATAAHLLSHQAGLPAFARTVPAEEAADAAARASELAGQKPEWTPGEAHGYHALTYGWLAGEIVRRLSGRTVGAFAKDEFTSDLDLWIGSPDDVIERAAKLSAGRRTTDGAGGASGGAGGRPPSKGTVGADSPKTAQHDMLKRLAAAYTDPESMMNRAMNNPHPGKGGYNNPVVLRAGWPSAGMITTAPALAGFYRDLVAGRILRPDTLREALRPRASGPDRTLLVDSAFGLGFMRPSQTFFTPKPGRASAFGHTGAGGSIGLGDPEAGLAVAYLPNLMGDQAAGDLRAFRLTQAAYAGLS